MSRPTIPTKTYRLFQMDGAGRISSTAELIDARDDDTAIARAMVRAAALTDGDMVELWCGSRLVRALGRSGSGDPSQPIVPDAD